MKLKICENWKLEEKSIGFDNTLTRPGQTIY
jgi:hypothetical protein